MLGLPVVAQSTRPFATCSDWLGLREVAVLEPPGVEPTSGASAAGAGDAEVDAAGDGRVRCLPGSAAARMAGRNGGVPVVKLPFTVGGTEGAKDLFGLFDDTVVARLLAADKR